MELATRPHARCSVWREIAIGPGSLRDYRALRRWHYRARLPAAATRVLVARHRGRPVGVIVEAMPTLASRARDAATGNAFAGGDPRQRARRINAQVRVISRVVVHPTYRGIGLGVRLVRALLETATTRYVEALAAMGKVNPFFEHAGMRRFDGDDKAYFLWP